ncbi:hypothetical protein GOBAR_DD04296 [Gossypium barbadense]|nr:hypothetical protein GOBAR_DD04296 [Gossypium barbadense]
MRGNGRYRVSPIILVVARSLKLKCGGGRLQVNHFYREGNVLVDVMVNLAFSKLIDLYIYHAEPDEILTAR